MTTIIIDEDKIVQHHVRLSFFLFLSLSLSVSSSYVFFSFSLCLINCIPLKKTTMHNCYEKEEEEEEEKE
jgi:hypothetical protein